MVTWPRPPPSPAPSRKTESVQLGQRQWGKASTTKESNANLSKPDHGEGPEHGSGRRDGGYRRGQAKRGTHNGNYAAETQRDGQQLRSAHPFSQQRPGKQHHEDRSGSSESRGVAHRPEIPQRRSRPRTDHGRRGEYRCSSRQKTPEPTPSRRRHWRVEGCGQNGEHGNGARDRRLPWAVK